MSDTPPYLAGSPDQVARSFRGCGCVAAGCGLVAGAVCAGGLYLLIGRGAIGGLMLVLFGLIGLGLAGWLAATVIRAATIECDLAAAPTKLRFRDSVTVTVRLSALRRCSLRAGNLRLVCRERAIARGGTSDSTFLHTAYEEVRPLEVNATLEPGEQWATSVTFRVPEGYPGSFSGQNNFIEWLVHLDLGLGAMMPALHQDTPVTVLPERA